MLSGKIICGEHEGGLAMTASDAFSEYYAELLQGTYDCVDRIVLNAFFPVGQRRVAFGPGGASCAAMI